MKNLGLVLLGLFFTKMSALSAPNEPDFVSDIPLESMLSQGTIHEAGIVRAMVSLGIVICMIYLTAWLYKKLSVFNNAKLVKDAQKLETNKFKVISSQSLGANKNLHVVEINGKYLVLGSTQNSISLIKEFDKNLVESKGSTLSVQISKQDEAWMNDLIDKYDDFGDSNAERN